MVNPNTFREWPKASVFKRTGKPTFKKPKKPKTGGGGPIDNPTDIAGLVLWLDGDDMTTMLSTIGGSPITAPGETVAEWQDKSGNGNHVTQASSALEPQFRELQVGPGNQLGAMRNAQTDFLERSSSALPQDQNVTVFYVARVLADETAGAVYSNADASGLQLSTYVFATAANLKAFFLGDSTGTAAAENPADVGTEFNQFTSVVDTNDITARLNGTAGVTVAKAGDGVTVNDYTRVFNQQGDQSPLEGLIAVLLVYNATLSLKDIKRVEAWAKTRYDTP